MKTNIGWVLKVLASRRSLAVLMVCGGCMQCSPQPSAIPVRGESPRPSEPDEAAARRERQAARRALAKEVLENFRARKVGPPSFIDFVQSLLEYCAEHGPRVDIRFVLREEWTSTDIDEELLESPRYTGNEMLPKQYFRGSYAQAREQRLGRRLQARLQAAFPKELVRFELGERVELSRGSGRKVPQVEVPTLFIIYTPQFDGRFFEHEQKGSFVQVRTQSSSVFRLPGQALQLKHDFWAFGIPTPAMLEEAPSTAAVYEAMATKMDENLSKQFFGWFFAPPRVSKVSRSAPTAPKQPDEPFEPDPAYLDPTHDDAFRRFHRVSARCGPSDPNCLPMPHNGDPKLRVGPLPGSHYQPGAKRNLVPYYHADPGTLRCSHDGECLNAGALRCVRWDTKVGSVIEIGVPDYDLANAFCGCVKSQCQWFTQRRPAIRVEVESATLSGWPDRLFLNPRALEHDVEADFSQELRRCFAEDMRALPRRISVNVVLKRDQNEQTGTVKNAPAKVARCLEQSFRLIIVSLRNVTDAELEATPVRLEATFAVSATTVP